MTESHPRVVLARHGETEWSQTLRHTSFSDIPLTAHGRKEAEALRPALSAWKFVLVVSSPRSRALETCRIAGFGDRAEVDPDLAEWSYGAFEGLTTAEIREQAPGWTVFTHPSPGGETAEQVAARVDRVIAKVRAAAGSSVLFAHGHVLRVLTARWLGLDPREGRHFILDTGTVSVLGWERETPAIVRWNAST